MKQVAEGPVRPGELLVAHVTFVRSAHALVVARGESGIVRGAAAGRTSVGDRVKIHVLEVNVDGRFEARILGG